MSNMPGWISAWCSQRQLKKDPIAQGGWSAGVGNWQGIDLAEPGRQLEYARRQQGGRLVQEREDGALRSQWLAAANLAEQQRICRDIQALSFEEIPYFPIGQYKQPTAYRSNITGILDGTAVFWNVKPGMSTIAIFGSYVLSREGMARRRCCAITGCCWKANGSPPSRATDRPPPRSSTDRAASCCPGCMNLHNHCFSEAVARTHTEDGNGRKNNQSIVYTVLLPLTKRGADLLSPEERLAIARLGILQLLKGGATTVMEPFRNTIPEMFDAAEEMGIRFYGAPYLFSTSDAKAGPDGRACRILRRRG